MCKVGDIIKIEKYIGDDGKEVGRHSFVVISEDEDVIQGYNFDFVGCPMSSIKSDAQREKVAADERLMIIKSNDQNGMPASNYEESFIKSNLFYYFQKNKIQYQLLGSLNIETYMKLMKQLEDLDEKGLVEIVTANL